MKRLEPAVLEQTALGAPEDAVNNITQHLQRVHEMIEYIGDSRELSIAKTKLEEAGHWLQAHIAADMSPTDRN